MPDDVAWAERAPADLGEQPHHLRALEAVEVHDVGARQHGQVGGLAALVAQPLQGTWTTWRSTRLLATSWPISYILMLSR